MRVISILSSLLALSFVAACRTAVPVETEVSVRTGLNERFLDDSVDVRQFVDLFEGESREVAVRRDEITARLGIRSGMAVADVGAGTGLYLEPLLRAVGKLGTVFAVELSPAFVVHLENRARELRPSDVRVVACTEKSVELAPGSVDLVFVCDTYHHFEYPLTVLASIKQALRPGGRMVILDFERIPALSSAWILQHVRIGKEQVMAEVESAGFTLEGELKVEGLRENYLLSFRR